MSSKFCLRKRGFWKKFLQKRYVKKNHYFIPRDEKCYQKMQNGPGKVVFFGMDVFSQNLHILKS